MSAWRLGLCLFIGSWIGSAYARAETITVTVAGAVAQPGTKVYPAGTRLSQVAAEAKVASRAYLLGAAWLQPVLQRQQLRLRAGLRYDLGVMRQQALLQGHHAWAALAAQLAHWLAALPVTGRRAAVVLDPVALEVTPADNWPVHDGDRLFYPARPDTIQIVGAVRHACRLTHVPLQDAWRYLAACPLLTAADKDVIYVVQPDGSVFKRGVALWNRDPPMVLAPGAWIYVPLNRRALALLDDTDFNHDFANFLATQLVGDKLVADKGGA